MRWNRVLSLIGSAAFCASFAGASEHKIPAALQSAPLFYGAAVALLDFQEDFEKSGAKLGKELIGIDATPVDDEGEFNVFALSSEKQLVSHPFDCHYHLGSNGKVEDAHCHRGGSSEPRDYTPAAGELSVARMVEGLVSISELFERAFGPVSKIQRLKVWRSFAQAEPLLQASVTWKNASGSPQTNFMYCHEHQHGNEVEFDCHRQRQPGPNQP